MKRKELGAHHIVPGEAGGTNDDEEIITESTPYKKAGESFERPVWHLWVYGGQKRLRQEKKNK